MRGVFVRHSVLAFTAVVLTACNGGTKITSITPNSGPASGGRVVTIKGVDLAQVTTVDFATPPGPGLPEGPGFFFHAFATALQDVDSTTVICTTPADPNPAVPQDGDVATVTVNAPGAQAELSNGFTYYLLPAPTVSGVTPSAGPTTGGTAVTVTGANFDAGTTVQFGSAPASSVTVNGSTSLVATTPPENAGVVDVTVTNPDTQSGVLSGGFTYLSIFPAPVLTSVMPTSGKTDGGDSVTLSGLNIQTGATVQFGSAQASNVTVNSGHNGLFATTPAESEAGFVDVTLTNPDGQSAVLPRGFTYFFYLSPVPTIVGVSPSTGPATGGTSVTIAGTNFQLPNYPGVPSVQFGSAFASAVTVNSPVSLSATTPAGMVGAVDVTVTAPDGQSAVLQSGFTYYVGAPPTISSVSPSSGPVWGGTAVAISGTNFASGATVQFGDRPASAVTVNSSTSLTATTPFYEGFEGAVNVQVTNSDGQSASLPNGFTYLGPAPIVSSVTPRTGPTSGGTAVTIYGDNFQQGAAVTFGQAGDPNATVNSPTTISATTPAEASGVVDVTVTNLDFKSGVLHDGFTYTNSPPPTLSSVMPVSGPLPGGTPVTLSGSNFQQGATVQFGSAFARVATVTPTSISATTPAGAGAVDVTVTNPDTQSVVLHDGFTYTDAPTLTSVMPTSGPVAGMTVVTLSGTNFQMGATAHFHGVPATAVTVNNTLSITATTPAGTAGAADVTVINPDGQFATLSGGFSYFLVTGIASGSAHTCALVNGGAQCWGSNVGGQLGNDSTAVDSYVPVPVSNLTGGVTAIVGGLGHTCALVNGGVQCWGSNSYGQLGNNTTNNSNVPVPVPALTSGVQAIAAAGNHTCAVDANGAAWCWGDNQAGDLGNNSTTESLVPVSVHGLTSGVKAIAAGADHSCAIDMNGAAWCWGDNQYGELGNNSTNYSAVPVPVQGLTSGVQVIAAGGGAAEHTCAIPANNTVMCWGNNQYGQLGNNSTTNSDVPVAVMGLPGPAQAVAEGFSNTCALVSSGVWCWGDNTYGELGNGTTTNSKVPVQVTPLGTALNIAVGSEHSCAVVNETAWCWGDNSFGDLGNNSQSESNVPVEVYSL